MTIRFIALSGFLGAGKTTAMLAAARVLDAGGHHVAVITNDQADDLVDTAVAARQTATVGQVSGGCFCCRFEDLMDTVTTLIDRDGADTVIAESVGSCTDLQATVVRPLMSHYADTFAVSPLTTVVDPSRAVAFGKAWRAGAESDLAYVFRQQLLDAEVIVLNKIDLYRPELLTNARQAIEAMAPGRPIVDLSARGGDGLDDLLQVWTRDAIIGQDLDIDYDRYAAAEAELAWCNTTVTLTAPGGIDINAWTSDLLDRISHDCASPEYTIGHVKVFTTTPSGVVKGAVTASGDPASLDQTTVDRPVNAATATVNARVESPPAALDTLILNAIEQVSASHGATTDVTPVASFKPAYPKPVHRISAAALRTRDDVT
ncbi:MAG: GTP-binding protein [Pseudonocardiaceae bacterium]